MRLLTNVRSRFLALGLTALLAACGRGAEDIPNFSSAAEAAPQTASYGPEADYPVVLGDPYTIEGQRFTPADTLNYDEVGYAGADPEGGAAVTASHKTLPLPSYVEITSLDTGKTVLVRVERRGPLTTKRLVGLSPGALSQLGVSEGSPIRIRRVNALEIDRAKLRRGQAASDRMETPKSLVAILKRKLPASGSVSLAQSSSPAASVAANDVTRQANTRPAGTAIASTPKNPSAELPAANAASFADAFSRNRGTVAQYPLPPLSGVRQAAAPARAAPASPPSALPNIARTPSSTPVAVATGDIDDGFVIQAAAFSSKANAERAATKINGFIQQSGRYYRVRKGPFANRGQAEAALAKIRAAGYRDARVFSAG